MKLTNLPTVVAVHEENLIGLIREKETLVSRLTAQISNLEKELSQHESELNYLKKKNAETIVIRWKESIKWCLEVDADNPYYFIKKPLFVSKCIAKKHGVEITTDIKNKISTTLSIMFNQGLIGRIQYNGASYYGLPKFFKKNLTELKEEYKDKLEMLRQ
jgi:hypothetical protein